MFKAQSSTAHRLARYRPLLTLLLPLALAPLASCAENVSLAQNYQTAPPSYQQPSVATPPPGYATSDADSGQFLPPPQLAELVAPVALYPDDLIGIILPASTYPLQVVQAARYLDAVRSNTTLAPDDSWDNAVVALLNYPDVVNMMDRDLAWTERLGQAVIIQQADVIAAIGQFRAQAQAAGNLRSDERQVVEMEQGAIRIRPANPQVIYVPQYEPAQVIVYQSSPVFAYYPRPYPVYYYNYADGYPSGFSNFWGVSTLFTIGWSSRRVHLHDYDYYDEPRFDHPYNGHFYRRSHHGRHDDDDHDDHDDDHGDHDWRDREHRAGDGQGRPPRERDWQPRGGTGGRPTAVGSGGQGRGHGEHGNQGGRGPDRGEPRDQSNQGPRGSAGSAPVPPRLQSSGGDTSERRSVRSVAPQQSNVPAQQEPGGLSRQPRVIGAPSTPAAMGSRRAGEAHSERRQLQSEPQNPAARFSAPLQTPRRMEREIGPARSAPTPAAPARNLRNNDDARSNARVAPSRPEPRMVTPSRPAPREVMPSRAEPRAVPRAEPNRQESRSAPSRAEPRAPAVSSRSSAGPAVRRDGDNDRGRNVRER